MTPSRKFAALLIAALAGAAATVYSIRAQSNGQAPNVAPPSAASTLNPNLVVLDPAHGGPDAGAVLRDNLVEKDVTLAVAAKLRSSLSAAGFTVITTHDANLTDAMTNDQRAEIANHAHAVACIVLHATATGSGVHVYTSTVAPSDPVADGDTSFVPIPWEMAQAGFKGQSLQLASDLVAALATENLPRATGNAPVRPLENLMCPAVAVEIAPLSVAGTDTRPVNDAEYQQRVVDALTAAVRTWRNQASSLASSPSAESDTRAAAAARAIAAAEAAGRAASGAKGAQ